ncbi:AMP-dependent synthetase/ligase [Nocardioides ganghwensis]|uniref:Acyl-CoA synthetase n=1 Tax=Nocardioides ganghwensis TaxID=252230 RepID=A0A4Q2SEY2_9ACTN|nr:AMP-binding protein [Nocardioides ganghwensis]MBD3947012.1 AMP-binding protein [Nocardioides ganghwensis]RYC01928.1 long-chain fatty acid--CoA ligase [Nocardioides ganghwensis]
MSSPVSRIRDHAAAMPDAVALRDKHFGIWREWTWASYWEHVQLAGHAYLALGVVPGDRVAIHSENRPEWLICDMGALAVRAASVGVYPTNPAAEVGYLLNDSGAKVLVAEDQEQVDKAFAVLDQAPDMVRIVYLEPRGIRHRYDSELLLSWEDFLELGREHRAAHPDAIAEVMAGQEPADLATLIYTSGTTGPPKGAMLTVSNVECAIQVLVEQGAFTDPPPGPKDLTLSYLPLAHVAERIFSTWFNAAAGTQVNFAESIETVPANLREVQPTILFGVPRIWEKLLAGVETRLSGASWFKRAVSRFWLGVADDIGERLVAQGGVHSTSTRLKYAVGYVFFYRALKDRLGMRKVRYAASGAAPIAPEVLKFFMGIGVPMHEVYGMTENTAVATGNRPGRIRLGTVGEVHPGTELRIDEETGEILTRSGATFAGYWQREEATRMALTPDGWLHTGDVGEWVEGTHVKITDRMKDIIITAGGKNISPSMIENELKASPFIREAIVIGDGRKYLTALIGIELDTVGEWAQRRQLGYSTYRDLSAKPEVVELVSGIVDAVNADLAQVERIKAFRLLPKELDHEDGELTATQKVKRSAISQMFEDTVVEMYGGATR